MNVMLINPPTFNVETFEKLGIHAPPLGLAYIAAVLEQENYHVEILDAQALGLSLPQVKDEIQKRNPDIVGVTAVTPAINSALQVVRLAKRVNPNITTIVGGPHVSFMAQETLESCKELDTTVIGEGEYTTRELLQKLERNEDLSNVKGIAFRKGNTIMQTEPRPLIEDLDAIPFPARHLLPMSQYKILNQKTTIMHMLSSRGCPFQCTFCSSSKLLGKRFRMRSADNVLEELEEGVETYKTGMVEFADDTFTLSNARVVEFCEKLKKLALNITWSCSSRVDTISRNIMEKMKEAGCSLIFFGVESGSQETLNCMSKGITLERVVKVFKWAKEIGIKTLASFIIGLPCETIDKIQTTIRFAKRLKPDFAEFSIATPYPGTQLYGLAKEKELLITEDWSKYTAGKPVMKNEKFSTKDLAKLFVSAYKQFYVTPRFLLRQLIEGHIRLLVTATKGIL